MAGLPEKVWPREESGFSSGKRLRIQEEAEPPGDTVALGEGRWGVQGPEQLGAWSGEEGSLEIRVWGRLHNQSRSSSGGHFPKKRGPCSLWD